MDNVNKAKKIAGDAGRALTEISTSQSIDPDELSNQLKSVAKQIEASIDDSSANSEANTSPPPPNTATGTLDKPVVVNADHPPPPPNIAAPLPTGWEIRYSEEHNNAPYYWNASTGESVWERPTTGGNKKRNPGKSKRRYKKRRRNRYSRRRR